MMLPLMVLGVALVGRRLVERRHAQEIVNEVKAGDDDGDWLQRTTGGG